MFVGPPSRKVGVDRYRRFAAENCVSDEFGGADRGCDSQSLVAGCDIYVFTVGKLSDVWQIVRSRRAKAGPDTSDRETAKARHKFKGPRGHTTDDVVIDLVCFCSELSR